MFSSTAMLLYAITLSCICVAMVKLPQLASRLLEPVYGSIATSISINFYSELFWALGIAFSLFRVKSIAVTLATWNYLFYSLLLVAWGISSIKLFFLQSNWLGPRVGPILTLATWYYPALFLLGGALIVCLVSLKRKLGSLVLICFTGLVGLLCLNLYQFETKSFPICEDFFFTCAIIGLATACSRLLLSKHSKAWLFLIPLILGIVTLLNYTSNPICWLNNDMVTEDGKYTLLRSVESVTGRIAVVEVNDGKYHMRVLRAGHSILGGIHLSTNESIYKVFYLPEAVRLTSPIELRKEPQSALVIGLGVGIIAHSFDLHGINVEAVELDPVIPYYAAKYFNLPFTLKQTIMDGAEFVKKADSSKYDYVVHDIFTGGSISGNLLTRTFFKDLKATLKPHGILALNFVGYFGIGDTTPYETVAATINSEFQYLKVCPESKSPGWMNMVFFASNSPFSFYPAIVEDFLGSSMRESVLTQILPNNLVDVKSTSPDLIIGHESDVESFNHRQLGTAFEHWHIMRNMFPLEFWLLY